MTSWDTERVRVDKELMASAKGQFLVSAHTHLGWGPKAGGSAAIVTPSACLSHGSTQCSHAL